jgi:hypothetical protein
MDWWTWSGSNRRPLPCHGPLIEPLTNPRCVTARTRLDRTPCRKSVDGFLQGWAAGNQDCRSQLKVSEFNILTPSHTPGVPPESCEELTAIALFPARTDRTCTRASAPLQEGLDPQRYCCHSARLDRSSALTRPLHLNADHATHMDN